VNMKNPAWTREEIILALDLYFKLDYGQMHGSNPYVIQLSKELRNLNIHVNIPEPISFRSINSVALKLANFKKLDQNFSGKGMRDGAKQDRETWKEFHRHRDTLKKEADLIRQLYLKPQAQAGNNNIITEQEANYKSEICFLFHKNRETDPVIVKVKKEMVLINTKSLKCEICNFDSLALYGELGNDLMEIHFNKEMKTEPGLEPSEMDDFIIVCPNCHKVLDKHFDLINANDLKRIIKKK
jgi:5-methylcytosine-specific restriction enzyme A